MQRFKSKRERNLNVDASLAAAVTVDSPLSSPVRKESNRSSAPPTPLSPGSNGLLSPRTLPASLDRAPPEYVNAKNTGGFLVYGMVVTCLSMDRGGFLASDGFITTQVRLEALLQSLKTTLDLIDQQLSDPGSLRDVQLVGCHTKNCLFEVVPKMAYEATTLYQQTKPRDSTDAMAPSVGFSDAFSDLKFKSDSEQRLNTNVYQKLHGTRVKYGQTIQLRHIKSGKYVSFCDANERDSVEWRLVPYDHSEKETATAQEFESDAGRGLRSGLCIRLVHLESNAWLSAQNDVVHLQGESAASPDSTDTTSPLLSSETLWEVEKSCFLEGGLLHWVDAVCLRHVVTGNYLHLEPTPTGYHVVADPKPQSFLLRPTTLVNSRYPIMPLSAVLLQHAKTSTYLHTRTGTHLHIPGMPPSLVVHGTVDTSLEPHDEDAFKVVPVAQAELQDTLRLVAYRRLCDQFIECFQGPGEATPRLEHVEEVLDQLNTFTFHDAQTPDQVLRLRQSLLHRHQFVLLLTRMLQAPLQPYGGPFSIEYVCRFQLDDAPREEPRSQGNYLPPLIRDTNSAPPPPVLIDMSLAARFQWPPAVMAALHRVLCAINILLFRIFYSSKTSDTSACRHAMPVLLQLLGHGFKASVPLSYLIQEKFHVSESFASFSAIVRNFLDLIKAQGQEVRYLQFLVVLCSANGHAVPKVQEKICELLFNPVHGYTEAVLVPTRATATGIEVLVAADEWIGLGTLYTDYYEQHTHSSLAPYFYGLLQLYCALCTDRNYTCIRCLETSFPRASLLACVQDNRLSRSIRAVLLNLLVVLHLDCEPQIPVAAPNLTRIWKDVLSAKDHVPVATDSMYAREDWSFFVELKRLVLGYLQKRQGILIITEAPQNDLTLAMVRLCKKMVEFGLFTTVEELSGLVHELVRLLDSRTDYWYRSSCKSLRDLSDAPVAPAVVTPAFFHRSSESTRFDLKAQNAIIQQAEGDATALDAVIRRESVDRQFSDNQKRRVPAKVEFPSGRRLTVSAPKAKITAAKEPPIKAKFKSADLTHIIMDIKDNICGILLHVDSLRVDSQISTVLMTLATEPPTKATAPRWRRHAAKPEAMSMLARAMFESPRLDCRYTLSVLAHRSLDTILLQTLMYEHPPLVSKALELLMQQFNQHEHVLKTLSNVLLLVNDETVSIYGKLQEDVQQLRRMAETTEVWMDLTSQDDFDVTTAVTRLLASFTALLQSSDPLLPPKEPPIMTTSTRIASIIEARTRRHSCTGSLDSQLGLLASHADCESDKRGETTRVEVRRLLRNLSAMQTVVGLLRDGNHFFKCHFPSILGDASRAASPLAHAPSTFGRAEQQQALRAVFVESMRFLNAFGHASLTNKSLLTEHAVLFIDLIEELDEAQAVLTTVFGTDPALAKCVPVRVLRHFLDLWRAELHAYGSAKPRYLHALDDFVYCAAEPIPENQIVVLTEIVKSENTQSYIKLLGVAAEPLLDLICSAKHTWTPDAMLLVTYHVDLLHVLASCAVGSDMRHKDICASILPFPTALRLVASSAEACISSLHEHTWLGDLSMALLRYLYEVHLTSEALQWPQQPIGAHRQVATALAGLLAEYTFNHVCNLQQIDAAALLPPLPHVLCEGGRMWVDVAAPSYVSMVVPGVQKDYYCTMVLTLVVPALHVCLADVSVPAPTLGLLYQTMYVLLHTSLTAATFAPVRAPDQNALLATVRALDKLESAQNDPSALETLACEVSARPHRPFLGNNRVLRPVVLGDVSGQATVTALYAQLQHPDTAMPSPPRALLRPKEPLNVSQSSPTKLGPLRQVVTPPRVSLVSKQLSEAPQRWAPWLNPHEAFQRCWSYFVPAADTPLSETKWRLEPVPDVEDGTVLDAFLAQLRKDYVTQAAIISELHAMMQRILRLEEAFKEEAETMADVPHAYITFDDVVVKLIDHFKLLKSAKYAKMSVILLEVFCQLIKSLEPVKWHGMQQRLDKLGVTALVVNIVSSTTDATVFDRCIELGIALLDGMNAKVQENFHATWTATKTTTFFEQIKRRIDKAADEVKSVADTQHTEELPRLQSMVLRLQRQTRHARRLKEASPEVLEKQYSGIANVFRFLQLLCEGHYLAAQRYLLTQAGVGSINLVEATTSFLLEIYPSFNSTNVLLFKQLFDTITEYCQGPCPEAQECVANYKFISVVNELMVVASSLNTTALQHMRLLKGAIVVSLLSLIEGRTDNIIHDRLVTELNFDTIKDNLVDVHRYFEVQYEGVYDGNPECSTDPFLAMGFNVHILIQHLMEHQPGLAKTLFPTQPTSHLLVECSFSLLPYEAFTRWLKQSTDLDVPSSLEKKELAYATAYAFFDAKCARVEIVWHLDVRPHLMQIYFPVHPICCCITERSKRRLKGHVSFDPSTKLSAFYAQTSTLLHEMEYQSTLRQKYLLAALTAQTHRLQVLSFTLALVINLIVLVTLRADTAFAAPYPTWQSSGTDANSISALLTVLGTVQIVVCTIIFVLYAIHTVPLLITEGWHAEKRKLKNTLVGDAAYKHADVDAAESLQDVEDLLRLLGDRRLDDVQHTQHDRLRNGLLSVRFLLNDPLLLYYAVLVLIPTLGTFYHTPYFAFHVLDIINRSQELKNVLKAIVIPGKSLLLIFALYLLIVYIFAVLGFYYFRPDYTPEAATDPNATSRCHTLFLCFLSSFDQAFKSNGGLGGFLAPRSLGTDSLATGRFFFDNAYNIILLIILLNITFGIIIDTFATIRTSHKEREEELRDRCFICSIDGYTFDRLTKRGFEYHTHVEHNMWHYLYLFVHINKKDYTEYNGVELYLAMKMAKNDVSFFPNHRAMALEKLSPASAFVPTHEEEVIELKKPSSVPVTLGDSKRRASERIVDTKGKDAPHPTETSTARLERQLDALFEQQATLRERQKATEDIQRQVLATQQSIMALLSQATAVSPPKSQRKSEHFFPE
ncbi:ryanodine-inositol 1,4,5-triphosphate receptor Ca2 channel (RIR-CaC) family protein [Achlya hypogyna]|uniref:Ryanodine-inositol 1,4,5-triphosphate receptor Ca2 channel (RIR-CaC) family protein n=1 Tax=Achlya hypogyna TaxID=1202772 RepID=A0A1V9Y6E0_ACHHY|nr:ryanodine-inositol 1,4,5-triphosphate receptor Ca2 channel (RIR-CaC) family protein [Achlya hypogyna]